MQTMEIFDIPHLRPLGRFHQEHARQTGVLPLFWAGSGLEGWFTGSELRFVLEADFSILEPWIAVEVDGAPMVRMALNRGVNEVCAFRGLAGGGPRHVRLYKEVQPMEDDPRHRLWVRGLEVRSGEFLPPPEPSCRLEFVGDSITSGEGLAGAVKEDAWAPAIFRGSRSWGWQTADLLGGEARLISQSGWGIRSGWNGNPRHALPDWYEMVCGPALGEADRALGSREAWDFASWRPDAVIVNLGTNDAGAMAQPPWEGPEGERFTQEATPEGFRLVEDAALAFLQKLRRCNPGAKLVWAYGMCDDALREPLERAVERFREEDGGTYYLPLPAVTGETVGSRDHPGEACHREAARITAAFLREIL